MLTIHSWRHSFIARIGVLALAGVLAAPGLAHAEQDVHVGTASANGVYYPAGGAICRLVNRAKNDHGLRCVAESTTGSLANLQALQKGTFDFAVVQSNWQYQALNGSGPFAGKAEKNLRSVFSLYTEPFTILVRADSSFHRFEDIRRARINLGAEHNSVRAMAEEIFSLLGWSLSDFAARSDYALPDQAKALCDGSVDVIFYTVGHPNKAVQDAANSCEMRIIALDGDSAKRLLSKAPYFTTATIPGGMYPGSPKDVQTIGVQATLVTMSHVPDTVVEAVVRSVFSNLNNFKTLHPVFARLEPRLMVRKGLTAPLHDAAKHYYEKAGLLPAATAKKE